MTPRPTVRSMETALRVLAWLHENTDDGSTRDEISHVRGSLSDVIDEREAF